MMGIMIGLRNGADPPKETRTKTGGKEEPRKEGVTYSRVVVKVDGIMAGFRNGTATTISTCLTDTGTSVRGRVALMTRQKRRTAERGVESPGEIDPGHPAKNAMSVMGVMSAETDKSIALIIGPPSVVSHPSGTLSIFPRGTTRIQTP